MVFGLFLGVRSTFSGRSRPIVSGREQDKLAGLGRPERIVRRRRGRIDERWWAIVEIDFRNLSSGFKKPSARDTSDWRRPHKLIA